MALAWIPPRKGAAPLVSEQAIPEQLTQNAPRQVQERLVLRVEGLRGVNIKVSAACTAGSRALRLAPKLSRGPAQAFLSGTEFAHMHPAYDGSLHMALPPLVLISAVAAGWGRPNDSESVMLLYGPRDEAELHFVWILLTCSYRYARNLPLTADPETEGYPAE